VSFGPWCLSLFFTVIVLFQSEGYCTQQLAAQHSQYNGLSMVVSLSHILQIKIVLKRKLRSCEIF
jgi:hypothetical protein